VSTEDLCATKITVKRVSINRRLAVENWSVTSPYLGDNSHSFVAIVGGLTRATKGSKIIDSNRHIADKLSTTQ